MRSFQVPASWPRIQKPPRSMRRSARRRDRKSTRLNSSHGYISYAVFCLKKKILYRSNQDDLNLASSCLVWLAYRFVCPYVSVAIQPCCPIPILPVPPLETTTDLPVLYVQ